MRTPSIGAIPGWPPGEKLEALELADEFGVSMTPVRDCLNRLVGELLVDMKPGEGYRVPRISEKALRDLLEFSSLLLNFAIDSRVTTDQSFNIESNNSTYADRVASLFDLIVSRSGNIMLNETMRSLSDRIHAIRRLDPQFFQDTSSEIEELERLAEAGRPSLRIKLNEYHDRRRGNDAYLMQAVR